MHAKDILIDGYGRVREEVHAAVGQLDELAARPTPEANSIAWLAVAPHPDPDGHVADAYGLEQVWRAEGWTSGSISACRAARPGRALPGAVANARLLARPADQSSVCRKKPTRPPVWSPTRARCSSFAARASSRAAPAFPAPALRRPSGRRPAGERPR
ncbi:hypothetical protein SALBM217S_03486 [Streptomyces griseoloalbus]